MALDPVPDFKNMTPEELRENLSALNGLIKDLRIAQARENKRFIRTYSAGTLATAVTSIVFPPAAIIILTSSTMMNVDPMAKALLLRQVLHDAEEMRDKFKTVWRARPGRKQFNLAARRAREVERKKQNRWFKFPGF